MPGLAFPICLSSIWYSLYPLTFFRLSLKVTLYGLSSDFNLPLCFPEIYLLYMSQLPSPILPFPLYQSSSFFEVPVFITITLSHIFILPLIHLGSPSLWYLTDSFSEYNMTAPEQNTGRRRRQLYPSFPRSSPKFHTELLVRLRVRPDVNNAMFFRSSTSGGDSLSELGVSEKNILSQLYESL